MSKWNKQLESGLEHARRVFEPSADRPLSEQDMREFQTYLVGFFQILKEWLQKAADEALDSPQRRDCNDEKV